MHPSIKRLITAGLLSTACLVAVAQQTVKGTVKDSNGEIYPVVNYMVAR